MLTWWTAGATSLQRDKKKVKETECVEDPQSLMLYLDKASNGYWVLHAKGEQQVLGACMLGSHLFSDLAPHVAINSIFHLQTHEKIGVTLTGRNYAGIVAYT